jgi:hypothetical protein
VKVEGDVLISAAQDQLWRIINDPSAMRDCMPGCVGLKELGADRYLATLEIGVGAMVGSFDAELQLSERHPPRSYRLAVKATGTSGDVQGGGAVTLEPEGPQTRLRYDAELHVTGLMALAGDWLLRTVTSELAARFFRKLGEIAAQQYSPRMSAD